MFRQPAGGPSSGSRNDAGSNQLVSERSCHYFYDKDQPTWVEPCLNCVRHGALFGEAAWEQCMRPWTYKGPEGRAIGLGNVPARQAPKQDIKSLTYSLICDPKSKSYNPTGCAEMKHDPQSKKWPDHFTPTTANSHDSTPYQEELRRRQEETQQSAPPPGNPHPTGCGYISGGARPGGASSGGSTSACN